MTDNEQDKQWAIRLATNNERRREEHQQRVLHSKILRDAQILACHNLHGMTAAQISGHTGISLRSVKAVIG